MDKIKLEKDAGLRFPAEEGFYGIIVSERPPMHVWYQPAAARELPNHRPLQVALSPGQLYECDWKVCSHAQCGCDCRWGQPKEDD